VKALFATAVEDRVLRYNTAAVRLTVGVAPDSEFADDAPVKIITPEQLDALLVKLPQRWRLFFELLAEMGLRIGEAVELRWRDVDFGEMRLHVRRRFYRGRVAKPKGRKTRTLTLTPEMGRALWLLRAQARVGDDDLVFRSDKGDRIDQSNMMSRVLKPAAISAGIGEWVGFHTFRHSCATWLIVHERWSLEQVQVFLGHADYATTRKYYVHLVPEDLPARSSVRSYDGGEGGKEVAKRLAEIAETPGLSRWL